MPFRIIKPVLCFLFAALSYPITAQTKARIYLFPGQGSDYRIFQNLHFPADCDTVCISYPLPDSGESLKEFAQRFVSKTDTTKPFILMGVSMGGMICSELSELIPAEKTIIISSAKCRSELPAHYRFQSVIPINRLVPPRIVKAGTLILQPLVEPDRNNYKQCFKSMLSSKSAAYLKRTADMIINWQKSDCSDKIIHIHGDSDNTLPLKNTNPDYIIPGGSHMMVLTQAADLQKILDEMW